MTRRYLNADASALLDAWVEASGVVPAMTLEGVSFWYGARLGHWLWLVDQLLWINVLDDLLSANPGVREITCDAGTDAQLVAAARLVGERDGLTIGGEAAAPAPPWRGARGHRDRGRRTGECSAPPPDVLPRPAPLAVPAARAGAASAARRETPQRDRGSTGQTAARRAGPRAPAHRHPGRTTVHQPVPRPGARPPAGRPPRPVRGRPARDHGGSRREVGVARVRRPLAQPPDRRRRHARGQDERHGQAARRGARPRRPDPRRGRGARGLWRRPRPEPCPDRRRPGGGLARPPDRGRRPDPRAPAPDARRGDPAGRRVPPPGLAGRRRCRGRAGRGGPARRHLPAAHAATCTTSVRRSSGSQVGPTCSGRGSETC